MADFDVTLTLLDNRRVQYTAANSEVLSADIPDDRLAIDLVTRFNDWVAKENSPFERADLELLGRLLFQTAFPSAGANIRARFLADYDQFTQLSGASDTDRFRVTLVLGENATILAGFPWEFLYVPKEAAPGDRQRDRGFFVGGARTKLILTRHVSQAPPAALAAKEGEPLRILVAYAHPADLPRIDSRITDEVIGVIQGLNELGSVEVRVEENPTYEVLRTLMNAEETPDDRQRDPAKRRSFRPDIFHFIGHGDKNRLALPRDPVAVLEERDRTPRGRPVAEHTLHDATAVLDLCANHTPRLVFLHACETAQRGSVESFSDLARSLVRSSVPSVIAMQYTIRNVDAGVFAMTFYEEIRKGSLLDEAVRAARAKLCAAEDDKPPFNDRRFGTPVVYFQQNSREPIIRVRKGDRAPAARPISAPGTAADRAGQSRPCPRCGNLAENFCTVCGLSFTCETCKKPYGNPLGNFCGQCRAQIEQPPYVSTATSGEVPAFGTQQLGSTFDRGGARGPELPPGERPN